MSAPMCTRVLADFGARVIKVENPKGGDFARDYDDVVNGPGGWPRTSSGQPRQGIGHPRPEVAAGMDVLHRLARPRRRLRVQPRAGRDRADGPRARRTCRAGTLTSSPSRSTATDPAARSRTSAPTTCWCRPKSGACAVTGYPGYARQARTARWPISPPGCTPRCRSWRCCSAAHAAAEGPAPAVELSLFDVMTDIMGYQLTYTQHSGIDQQPLGVSSPAVAPYGAFAHPRRPDRGARHHQRPRMATGGPRDHRPPRPGRRSALRHQRRPLRAPRRSSTRPSKPGVRSMISRTSRRSPTTPASATPGTTCPARSSCTRS